MVMDNSGIQGQDFDAMTAAEFFDGLGFHVLVFDDDAVYRMADETGKGAESID